MKPIRIKIGVISICVITVFFIIVTNFFPNVNGNIGHDYSLFFPHLLDGVYWFRQNGIWEVPWFTPAFGGGLPKFPNPQSIYYSVPQFLCFVFDPIVSMKITILLFGILGFVGFYLLLSKSFKLNEFVSITGAVIFLFNGFYLTRMIVGHVTFHSFMLLPVLAYYILKLDSGTAKGIKFFRDISVAGFLIAYMIFSGAFHIIPITIYAIIVIAFVQILYFDQFHPIVVLKFGFSFLIGLLLSASILNASVSYLSLFPRDFYPLPGFNHIGAMLGTCFKSLFFTIDASIANIHYVNKLRDFGLHEFEYGMTIIPLLFIIYGIVYFLKKKYENFFYGKRIVFSMLLWLMLLVPIVLNLYSIPWNNFLKSIPFFKSSSTLVRWFASYIPIVILLASISFNQVKSGKLVQRMAILSIMLIIMFSYFNLNRNHYNQEQYNPDVLMKGYYETRKSDFTPLIEKIGFAFVEEKDTLVGNNLFVKGFSQMYPYEPIFGYDLEVFPFKSLKPGMVWEVAGNGRLNIKNPVSYVFPEENNLKPGDHFKKNQKREAELFVNYKSFDFKKSKSQKVANLISLASFAVLLLFVFFWVGINVFWKANIHN